jgi:hypothetical protein
VGSRQDNLSQASQAANLDNLSRASQAANSVSNRVRKVDKRQVHQVKVADPDLIRNLVLNQDKQLPELIRINQLPTADLRIHCRCIKSCMLTGTRM